MELNLDEVTRVQVVLRDPQSWDADGRSIAPEPSMLEWSEIPWRPLPELCYDETDPDVDPADDRHHTTVCPECFEDWASDYWVRLWAGDRLLADTQAITLWLDDQGGADGGSVF